MNISTINFERTEDKSLYKQLASSIITQIQQGYIQKGDRLPSVRNLSKQLDLSKSTISNAYDMLVSEGYLITRSKSGYYCDVPSLKTTSHPSIQTNNKTNETYRYNLSSRAIDVSSFDIKVWKRYSRLVLDREEVINSYGTNQGELELRESLATYLYQNRSVFCNGDELFIGAGIQPLLYFLFSLFREEKLRFGFYKQEVSQVSAVVLDCKNEVKIIESIEAISKKTIDILYIAPNNENLSLNEKIELLKRIEDQHIYLIEDDYNGEIHYLNAPKSAMQSLVENSLVIYLNSFSKLLIPSCRMACMVLPQSLLENAKRQASNYNQTASKIEQLVFNQYILDGHLERRIKYLKKSYKQKYEVMYPCLCHYFNPEDIVFDQANTRFIILKQFDEAFYEKLKQKKISVSIIQGHLALYFSGIEVKDIPEAIDEIFA